MRTYYIHRKKIRICALCMIGCLVLLCGRLIYVMIFQSERLTVEATELHERERSLKAKRGRIISSDGVVLADNTTVCTVSVIHSQIEEPERVVRELAQILEISEEKVRSYVKKISSREIIKQNVTKEVGDRIRALELKGVKVDEDSKRYYPYNELLAKTMGFCGADNQGILGLEAKYEDVLRGIDGQLLTMTDAHGIELPNEEEKRVEPIPGDDLYISIDYTIQCYCMQSAIKTYYAKGAKSVSIIVMNPQNGEIYAMVNYPEYDLNNPYVIDGILSEDMQQLNAKWRNGIINDTYEPGSTFKMITATAALSERVVSLSDSYYCTGHTTVGGRTIHCHKTTGHGSESFAQTIQNSCNPAFITWGQRVGVNRFLAYMDRLGLLSRTGVDVSGEAQTIIHKRENIHELELATMSFGQSFQITPLQLMRAASCIVNGGTLVTPHFAVKSVNTAGEISNFAYNKTEGVLEPEISSTMRELLRSVVEVGGGSNCYIDGYSIGGKTATSQKLPRSMQKYIASFIGFAPAENPTVMAMCLIDEPQGTYYGGIIAAPVIKEIFENIFPYLGIDKINTN